MLDAATRNEFELNGCLTQFGLFSLLSGPCAASQNPPARRAVRREAAFSRSRTCRSSVEAHVTVTRVLLRQKSRSAPVKCKPAATWAAATWASTSLLLRLPVHLLPPDQPRPTPGQHSALRACLPDARRIAMVVRRRCCCCAAHPPTIADGGTAEHAGSSSSPPAFRVSGVSGVLRPRTSNAQLSNIYVHFPQPFIYSVSDAASPPASPSFSSPCFVRS